MSALKDTLNCGSERRAWRGMPLVIILVKETPNSGILSNSNRSSPSILTVTKNSILILRPFSLPLFLPLSDSLSFFPPLPRSSLFLPPSPSFSQTPFSSFHPFLDSLSFTLSQTPFSFFISHPQSHSSPFSLPLSNCISALSPSLPPSLSYLAIVN